MRRTNIVNSWMDRGPTLWCRARDGQTEIANEVIAADRSLAASLTSPFGPKRPFSPAPFAHAWEDARSFSFSSRQPLPCGCFGGQPLAVEPSLPAARLAALAHGLPVLRLAVSASARLLSASVDGIDRRPGAPLRFVLGDSALFVSFF